MQHLVNPLVIFPAAVVMADPISVVVVLYQEKEEEKCHNGEGAGSPQLPPPF